MKPTRRYFVAAAVAVVALVGVGIAALGAIRRDDGGSGPRVARNEPVEEETAPEPDDPAATADPSTASGSKRAPRPNRPKGGPARPDADPAGVALARTGPTTTPWTASALVLMMLGTRVLLFAPRGPRPPRNKDLWDSPPPPRASQSLVGV